MGQQPTKPSLQKVTRTGRFRKIGAVTATMGVLALATTAVLGQGVAPAEQAAAATSTPVSTAFNPTCQALPFDLPAVADRHKTTKKAWAFYFPPFPVSIDNKPATSDKWGQWMNTLNSKGGAYDMRDRPLTAGVQTASSFRQKNFEVEVQQAVAAGLDGFIWEYKQSADERWNQLPAMLAAAKKVDPNFKIMLSPDFDTAANSTSDSVYKNVMKVKDDSAIYREGGQIVLAPFYPERKTPAWWDGLKNKLASSGVKSTLRPVFLSWGSGTEKSEWNKSVSGYSTWGTRSLTGVSGLAKNSAEAHKRGKTWMQPVAFEDTRSYDGRYWESSNSSTLRDSLKSAIDNGADSVALMTWNDYTESWVAPSKERGYAVLDTAAYYIKWFKEGTKPVIKRDGINWFHRSHLTTANPSKLVIGRNGNPTKMYTPNGSAPQNQVEMVASLKGDATLRITQGSNVKTLSAKAGVTSFKAPLVTGATPKFEIIRNGATVVKTASDTPVKSSVSFQDMMYHSGGSDVSKCARPAL